MTKALKAACAITLLCTSLHAGAQTAAGEANFRELYKELIETNTALSNGNCTLAAERMAARLKAAGFADSDLRPFAAPDHPKEGGLVAIYPGRDPKLKAIWENRSRNPQALERALKVVAKEMQEKYSVRSDPDLVKSQRALKTSQQQMATTKTEEPDDGWTGLSEEEFQTKWQRSVSGGY